MPEFFLLFLLREVMGCSESFYGVVELVKNSQNQSYQMNKNESPNVQRTPEKKKIKLGGR